MNQEGRHIDRDHIPQFGERTGAGLVEAVTARLEQYLTLWTLIRITEWDRTSLGKDQEFAGLTGSPCVDQVAFARVWMVHIA